MPKKESNFNKSLSILAKSSIWVFAGVILSKILGYAYRIIVARYYGPEVYGLLVIERKEATIGLLIGKKIKTLQHVDSFVPGKVRAGGQSAARYHRITEGLAKDFYRKIAEILKKQFFQLRA